MEAQISELTVLAPVGGLVTTRVAEIGENFSPGAPLISLVDMNNLWLTFNVREDFLDGVEIDEIRTVRVPALADREVEVRVTVMNVLGPAREPGFNFEAFQAAWSAFEKART